MSWLKNYFNERKAWRIVRREYKKNKRLFDAVGLKTDWFGRMYKVINRDPDIELGSGEDEVYLRKELAEVTAVLVKTNLMDIMAYELTPLEDVTQLEDGKEEFEHGYLITLTPAWNLDRQYVTFWSVLFVDLTILGLLAAGAWAFITYLLPLL